MTKLKWFLMTAALFAIFLPTAVHAQDTKNEAGRGDTKKKFQLHVSLFPWVPEAESLFQWVEAEFERQYWWIDLVVRDLEKSHDWKPAYVGDLAYEWGKTSTALTNSDGDDFQHLVEVDTMILGKLIKAGSIQPFTIPDRSFLPFSSNSVNVGGTAYGVPHWT